MLVIGPSGKGRRPLKFLDLSGALEDAPPERLVCRSWIPKVCNQRLQRSSFLVVTCFLLKDYYILPKKEPHSSLWVES